LREVFRAKEGRKAFRNAICIKAVGIQKCINIIRAEPSATVWPYTKEGQNEYVEMGTRIEA
jgi:hypothetical protein